MFLLYHCVDISGLAGRPLYYTCMLVRCCASFHALDNCSPMLLPFWDACEGCRFQVLLLSEREDRAIYALASVFPGPFHLRSHGGGVCLLPVFDPSPFRWLAMTIWRFSVELLGVAECPVLGAVGCFRPSVPGGNLLIPTIQGLLLRYLWGLPFLLRAGAVVVVALGNGSGCSERQAALIPAVMVNVPTATAISPISVQRDWCPG